MSDSAGITYQYINPVYAPSLDRSERYVVIMGGAGSGKSIFVGQNLLREASDNGHRILVIRKVRNSCKLSTFKMFKDILSSLGLKPKINHTDLTFSFKSGGEILHGGMDDPEKIKSIAAVNIVWIEEASELAQEDLEQLDLRVRGRGKKQLVYTFNPVPQSRTLFQYLGISTEDLPQYARSTNRFETKARGVQRDIWYQHTTWRDNPFLDEGYKQALYAQDPAQFKIYAEGMLADEGSWDLVIQFGAVEKALGRDCPGDHTYRMGVDVSEGVSGGDPSVIAVLEGGNLIRLERKHCDTATLTDHIIGIAKDHGCPDDNIAVDGVGVGAGVIAMLDKNDYRVTNVKAGRTPVEDEGFGGSDIEYQDVRTQMWWFARHMFNKGSIGFSIPQDETLDMLREELTAPRYRRVGEKKIQVEPKDTSGGLAKIRTSSGAVWGVRQRLGRSTDCADAYIQALFVDYLKERSWLFDDEAYDDNWTDPLVA